MWDLVLSFENNHIPIRDYIVFLTSLGKYKINLIIQFRVNGNHWLHYRPSAGISKPLCCVVQKIICVIGIVFQEKKLKP